MKLSRKEQRLLALGAAGGFLLAAALFVLVPRWPSVASGTPQKAAAAETPRDTVAVAQSAYKKCGQKADAGESKIACYEKILVPLVASAGVETAMGALGSLGRIDRDVVSDGHIYAHAIGIAAYAPDKDMSASFGRCNELYQSGCYHGVIQAYFEHAQDRSAGGTLTPEAVNALCQSYRGPDQLWLLFQCVHGMGHGLTMVNAHDLPLALQGCDLLTEAWEQESCYGGAFMENIVNATNPHHPAAALGKKKSPAGGGTHDAGGDHGHGGEHPHGSAPASASSRPAFKALDRNDLHYPCSILDARYQPACYEMQTSVILYYNGGDFAAAAKTCEGAPPGLRHVCHQSLGRDASSYSLQDHEQAIRLCSQAGERYQPWCYVGLVKNFVDLTARTENGFAFCAKIPGVPNRMKCYEALGEQIGVLEDGPAEREALCGQAGTEYLEACRYGARLTPRKPDALPTPPA